jgi:hypothetical protein
MHAASGWNGVGWVGGVVGGGRLFGNEIGKSNEAVQRTDDLLCF